MFMFMQHILLLTSFLSLVLTLPLVRRDVVDPHVTSPTAGTVWHVGQTQTVSWNTTGLPVNQTNPKGMLVLGYWYNNSENLMLNSPLATGLNYSVGQAQITVPNVPTRSDYIVVLFGDSGNASPEFTIISDASSSAPAAPSPGPPGSAPTATAPLDTTPPPSTTPPVNFNPANSSPAAMTNPLLATATAPSGLTTASNTSAVVVVTASSSPSSTKSSAAWQTHVPSIGTSLSVVLAVIYLTSS